MRVMVTTLLILAGCDDTSKDTETAPPIEQGDDTAEVCGGTAPVCSELTVEARDGLFDYEGTDYPVLRVGATGEDADADMKTMTVELWWDDVVDGAVDTAALGELGSYTFDTDACASSGNTLYIDFAVDGTRFDYVTTYEFAGRVYDSTDMASEIVIASGTTPNELGEAR